MHVPYLLKVTTGLLVCSLAAGCDEVERLNEPASTPHPNSALSGRFSFPPLPTSAACGQNAAQPFVLPPGYTQTILAREGDGGTADLWDMHTQNETGPEAGRFLYRTHEIGANGQLSVTDLETGVTRVVAQRAD